MELVRDAVSDLTLSDGAGVYVLDGSGGSSRDMPGRPLLPENILLPEVPSSLSLLYAALPRPRSAVCLNHDGSLAAREAAIWSRDGSDSPVEPGLELALLGGSTIDIGRLPPRDVGRRCCHDSVPDRASDVALGDGFDAESKGSDA